ncbi:ABC transporter substrate-binding protein [Salinisphaera aquimarina]|uniref:ABC transporter substrate-binding protein n=1 Tax=Salinisphaera aquimarina TaxID=2094031 RepID=A0ABV7EUR6_9GAMM
MNNDHDDVRQDRRKLLKAGAALGAAATIGPFFIGNARAAEPLRIGLLLPKSGSYAVQGAQGQQGAMLALEDFGGHVNDRPVEVVWYDENGPQTTQQNMHKLIEEKHVVAVQGGISSGDILAIMPVAERASVPLMATGPNASEITGAQCSKHTFRVDLPNYTTVRSVYPELAKHGKNWYFIYASYAWGIDGFNQMKGVLTEDGGKVVGADKTPLGTTDFSSYILKVMSAEPDALFLGIGGSDLTNFLKQFHQMGLTDKLPISALVANDTDLWSAGPAAATGIYPKIWNYANADNTQKSNQFAKTFEEKHGKPPESQAWQDYFGMSALLTALKQAKSTDGKDMVAFLEQHKFEGYKERPIYFRSWDHQLIQPTLVASVKKEIPDKYDYFDIASVQPGASEPLESIFPDQQTSECQLG